VTASASTRPASESSAGRSFLRRWPPAVGLLSLLTIATASVLALPSTFGSQPILPFTEAIQIISFIVVGACGGTAVALQQTFRLPKLAAPFLAIGLVLLSALIMWLAITSVKPIGDLSYGLAYGLAVWTPFGVVGAAILTFVATFIPEQKRKIVTIVAASVFALTTVVSIVF